MEKPDCGKECQRVCRPRPAIGASYVGDGNCDCKCGECDNGYYRDGVCYPNKTSQMKRKMRFQGMNPVAQRPIGVNPSQGGFFSVPRDERNFGQQASLPYDQQLNMNHKSNFAHLNMNHKSNFAHKNFIDSRPGGNQNDTWVGAQTNVGAQDRIFAGASDKYSNMAHKSNFSHCGAHGGPHSNMNHKSNFVHSNFAHKNFAHSNFAHNNFAHNNFAHKNFAHKNFAHKNFAHKNFVNSGNQDAVFSGGTSNVGPQDRVYAGNYMSGDPGPFSNFVTCYDFDCCRRAAFDHCGGQYNTHNWALNSSGEGCSWVCLGGELGGTGGGQGPLPVAPDRLPKKVLKTRLGGGRGGSRRRVSQKR